MPTTPRSAVAIASSSELSLRWAEVLSRAGRTRLQATIIDEDRAWAGALDAAMREHRAGAWSCHVAAGGWLTPWSNL